MDKLPLIDNPDPSAAGDDKKILLGNTSVYNPGRTRRIKICSTIFLVLFNLALTLCLVIIVKNIEDSVHNASKVCSSNDQPGYDSFKDPPSQILDTWFYNMTNPYEYSQGASANLVEIGPYSWSVDPAKSDIVFSSADNKKTLAYKMYYDLTFNQPQSCDQCFKSSDVFWFSNLALPSVLQAGKSEGAMMLASTCTPTQLGAMTIVPPQPVPPLCKPSQIGTAATCRCCNTALVKRNASAYVLCTEIASKSSKAGGIWSYLGTLQQSSLSAV
jgi:hypothetical protein